METALDCPTIDPSVDVNAIDVNAILGNPLPVAPEGFRSGFVGMSGDRMWASPR